MKKILAVDYGSKRIGLAVNHEWLAEPLKIIPNNEVLSRIFEIIQQEKIEIVLIGVADGVIADQAKIFGKNIAEKAGKTVEVIEVDETLSSVEIHKKLTQGAMPKKQRQQPIDHFAAAAILQDYIDTHPA